MARAGGSVSQGYCVEATLGPPPAPPGGVEVLRAAQGDQPGQHLATERIGDLRRPAGGVNEAEIDGALKIIRVDLPIGVIQQAGLEDAGDPGLGEALTEGTQVGGAGAEEALAGQIDRDAIHRASAGLHDGRGGEDVDGYGRTCIIPGITS